MHSTRFWVHVAMGLPLPKRDRDAKFFADASELLPLIDDLSQDCLAALDSADTIDPNAPRDRKRTTGEVVQLTVAYAGHRLPVAHCALRTTNNESLLATH
jgi:hypothetical protein